MPTYAYHCENCKTNSEFSQKITDEPLKICPSCEMPSLKRGPGGGIGLSFKGSGFYITDYAKGTPSDEAKSSSTECCPCGKNQCG
ncbi:MAG: zinc ribbon domain-containing protein [Parachlamydiaceae bacterium]|nr:MAG: zinc ribbon domain-containing protein [Parachlamydiaceae bacterium]